MMHVSGNRSIDFLKKPEDDRAGSIKWEELPKGLKTDIIGLMRSLKKFDKHKKSSRFVSLRFIKSRPCQVSCTASLVSRLQFYFPTVPRIPGSARRRYSTDPASERPLRWYRFPRMDRARRRLDRCRLSRMG